jgi:hypothetical protein
MPIASAKKMRDGGSIVELVVWRLSRLPDDFESDVNAWREP